jgi:site-specific recombinase XerD
VRQIHGRLARLERQTPSRRLPHEKRSRGPSEAHAFHCKPHATSGTIARAAAEFQQAQKHNPNIAASLRSLVAQQGSRTPASLDAAKVQAAAAAWAEFAPDTKATYSKCLRRFLRWLEETGAAPKTISHAVPKFHQPPARGIVATDDERARLLAAAKPHLRFFLLLCSEIGLRHRTAARISLAHYDRNTRSLRFLTKGNVFQTLPVTDAIAQVIESFPEPANRDTPIIKLLHQSRRGQQLGSKPRLGKAWNSLKDQLGIRAELHIHDLRRTVAEDVWDATMDIRLVQAQLGHRSPVTTVRYLANKVQLADLQPVIAKVQAMRAARANQSARPQPAEGTP